MGQRGSAHALDELGALASDDEDDFEVHSVAQAALERLKPMYVDFSDDEADDDMPAAVCHKSRNMFSIGFSSFLPKSTSSMASQGNSRNSCRKTPRAAAAWMFSPR